jgi:hypothetical protein
MQTRQLRLLPHDLTPAQVAFRRAQRIARAIAKYGAGEGRSHRCLQALREGLAA